MFKPKKLSLAGVTLLFISVALIFLSKTAVNQVAFNFVVNGDFGSVSSLNTFTFACALAGYFLMFAGAGLFVYVGWRSRFVVDAPTVKRQLRALVVASAVLLVTLSLFCTQAASANSLATTGYYLATPYSPYDWLIGNFSSGTYYAINGSNWANMMTWPTPAPWSDYAGNSTEVIEAALAATSAGTLYLKEVYHNYSLTIPANVQVIENVNGLTRTFVASSESTGSPYTVSVDGVQSGYYLCQDSAGRYLDEFTSTDVTTTLNNAQDALTSGGKIFIRNGLYTTNQFAIHNPNVVIEGEGWGTDFELANTQNQAVFLVTGANCSIRNLQIGGNRLNQAGASQGIFVYGANNTVIDNVYVHDTYSEGINVAYGSQGTIVSNFRIDHTGQCGLVVYGQDASPNTRNIAISNGVVTNSGLRIAGNNLWFSGAQNCTATNLVLDTASDGNFEIQSDGIAGGRASGITASGITCVNANVGPAAYLDGKNATAVLKNVILNNFVFRNSSAIGLLIGNYVDNVEVGNGVIEGTGQQGIYLTGNVNNAYVHHVQVSGTTGNGAQMTTTVTNSTFEAITVTGAQGAAGGIVISSVSSANAPNTVLNCVVSNSAVDNIYVYQAEGTIIRGCRVTSGGQYGMNIGTSDYVQVLDNTVRVAVEEPISFSTCNNIFVSGNQVYEVASGKYGIKAVVSNFSFVSNNRIDCTTATGRSGIGLWNNLNCTLQNNYIYNCATGINTIDANVIGTLIEGNTIVSSTAAISNTGTNTTQKNNMLNGVWVP